MHLTRTLPTLLALFAVTPAMANSARVDSVRRLIEEGRIDTASAKCDRLSAQLSDTSKDLREICAEAKFEEALEVNQVMTWIEFQQVWEGTSYAAAARDNEAAAALRDLGTEAEEHEYVSFIREYRDTKYALAAKQMVSDAAIRGVKTGKEAVRVAQLYPNHKNTPLLVEKFLSAFLKMEMDGLDVVVSLEPDIPIPGPPPTGRWAAKHGEEAYLKWEDAAETHLKDISVSPNFIDRAKKDGLPPCQVHEASWELGILVEVGQGKAFFPNRGLPECRTRPWPAFTVLDNNRLAALSLDPATVLTFPTDATKGWFAWGSEDDKTKIWTSGAAGDPILVNGVIGQPVGNLFLLTPLAGGMPWYVSQGPPPTAMPIPIEAMTTPLPGGWELKNANGAFSPGNRSVSPVQVEGGALAGTPWKLPPGEVRIMSPLVQQITGLTRNNEALGRTRKPRLPALTGSTGPMGASPVTFTELTMDAAQAVGRQMNGQGLPVKVWKAWEGRLGGTSGSKEVIFDGEIAGTPVKGVLDPMENSSGFRAFLWHRDERAQKGPEEVFGFTHDGAVYFVWQGKGPGGDYHESVHFEDIGLVREFR